MEYPATLIAYIFVKKGIETKHPITQLQVQKMVYFAHGYHLAMYNEPLVIDIFQAWQFGPVIPTIYEAYKAFGSDKIEDLTQVRFAPNKVEIDSISARAKETIEATWEITKEVPAAKLSMWTHKQGSPWSNVYVKDEKSTPIPNKEIKKYFSSFLPEQQ